MRFRGALLVGMAPAVMVHGYAQAQELRSQVVVSSGFEVVSNPFLNQAAAPTTAAVNLKLKPRISYIGEQTTADLTGNISLRQFFKNYSLIDNYAAGLAIKHRASDKITIMTGANFELRESGSLDLVFASAVVNDGLGPNLPITTTDPVGEEDVTTLGRRTRSRSVSGNLGVGYRLDSRNRFNTSLSARSMHFDGTVLRNYNNYSAGLDYYHVVDNNTGYGLNGHVSVTDYTSSLFADSRTFTASASATHGLGDRWKVNLSLGAAFSRIKAIGVFPVRNTTSFSPGATICYKAGLGNACLRYQRSPQATARGGLGNSDNLALTYQLQTSANGRIVTSASYSSLAKTISQNVTLDKVEQVAFRARYEHDFGRRFTAYTSASYAKLSSSVLTAGRRLEFGVGVSVKLGDPR